MYVRPGTRLFTIADLSKVWVMLDAYESDLAWLKKGQEVQFTTEAYPGVTFKGKVAFIDPFLNNATRTIKVRLVVKNKDGRLKPDMFVRAEAASHLAAKAKSEKPPLVIPATAPLITGKRAVVYLAVRGKPGTFRGRIVKLGPRAGDHYVVLDGLKEGDVVVTHGNFKIDSAIQILAKPSMMNPKGGGPVPGHDHGGHGKAAARAPDARKGEPVKVPPAFIASLGKAFKGYLAVQSGLAGDDLSKAKTGAKDLLAGIKGVKMKALKGRAHHEWMKLDSAIRGSAGKVAAATDIKSARKAFDHLSKAMIETADRFGVPKGQPLYRFRCTMAFNNRGADWLQGKTGTLNPYYGSEMLTCGTQEEVISPGGK
jgi:Cu(I)/Ag(I) efflux system membrane fusion protein